METQSNKFCRDCEHLAKSSLQGPGNWKCMAPQNIYSKGIDMVTGEQVIKRVFLTCYDTRTESSPGLDSCGPEAKWFKLRELPSIVEPAPGSSSRAKCADDLLSQLDAMK